jgi:hypothetical protein
VATPRVRVGRPLERHDAEPYRPSAEHLAAAQRLAREPDLLAKFTPGTWVAFQSEAIVASSTDYAEVVRTAKEGGASDPILVPVMPDLFVGGPG